MKSKTINFFATESDIKIILQLVEEVQKVKYVECGLFLEPIEKSFYSFEEIPKLGISSNGDINFEPFYLIIKDDTEIVIRTVPQSSGGARYAIDQAKNPESIVFKSGGVYQNNIALLAGQIGTTLNNPISMDLFNLFSKFVKKHFVKIDGCLVGNEAKELLENGVRLTSSVKSPLLYDLKNIP
jgi:hypothetical protein